jgi:cytochrome c oxidase assembly protein subunit 11
LRVHPGQTAVAYYEARNTTAEAITGQAVPSVAPNKAAAHFKKIECFCFTRQTLAARETRQMPVRFVVDANLPRDVHTVTLSYAFFNADQASARKYGGNAPAVATHEHHAADGQAAGG